MNAPLRQSVDDYLQVRRALGYKLTIHGRALPQFARFLEQRDATVITAILALECGHLFRDCW